MFNALDRGGQLRWKTELAGIITATALIVGDVVVLGTLRRPGLASIGALAACAGRCVRSASGRRAGGRARAMTALRGGAAARDVRHAVSHPIALVHEVVPRLEAGARYRWWNPGMRSSIMSLPGQNGPTQTQLYTVAYPALTRVAHTCTSSIANDSKTSDFPHTDLSMHAALLDDRMSAPVL
jgi:hypothetical protein